MFLGNFTFVEMVCWPSRGNSKNSRNGNKRNKFHLFSKIDGICRNRNRKCNQSSENQIEVFVREMNQEPVREVKKVEKEWEEVDEHQGRAWWPFYITLSSDALAFLKQSRPCFADILKGFN